MFRIDPMDEILNTSEEEAKLRAYIAKLDEPKFDQVAIDRYLGKVSNQTILNYMDFAARNYLNPPVFVRREATEMELADAQRINRGLKIQLNRIISAYKVAILAELKGLEWA